MRRAAPLLALALAWAGCERGGDVPVRVEGAPAGTEVELRLYGESTPCAAFDGVFAGDFLPRSLPELPPSRVLSPFASSAGIAGLPAGRYTVLAWSDPGACSAQRYACRTIELPPSAPIVLTLQEIEERPYCESAGCASAPHCSGGGDAGPPCAPGDACCELTPPGSPCTIAMTGDEGLCVDGWCLPTFCADADDGLTCATESGEAATCCSGICEVGVDCPADPCGGRCHPPLECRPGGICRYRAELTADFGATGSTTIGRLVWVLPDRTVMAPANGEVRWDGSGGSTQQWDFGLDPPPTEARLCSATSCPGTCCGYDLDVAFAAFAAYETGTGDPVGWGQTLFLWTSRGTTPAEVQGHPALEGIALPLTEAVPAGLSVWVSGSTGTPGDEWRRAASPPQESLALCSGAGPCSHQGPVPGP